MLIVIPIALGMVGYVIWSTRDGEVFVDDALADAGGETEKGTLTYFELFHAHAQAVEDTVNHMLTAVNMAADGEDPKEAIKATIAAELRADNVKND